MGSPTDHEGPRPLGPIAISDGLQQTLSRLQPTGAELDADKLHAAEVAHGFRFANDILAVYAAEPKLLKGFRIDQLTAFAGLLAEKKAPGDLLGLATRDDEIICLEKRTAPREQTVLHAFSARSKKTRKLGTLEDWLQQEAPQGKPSIVRKFAPTLIRVPPSGDRGRRVTHKVFGHGRVYVDKGGDDTRILKVAFDKGGLKMIQARFLSFDDE